MIKWKSKQEIDAEKVAVEEKKAKKDKFKGKNFSTLSRAEKDELLEILVQEKGLL